MQTHHSQGTAALIFTADTPFGAAGFAMTDLLVSATFVIVLDDGTEAAGMP